MNPIEKAIANVCRVDLILEGPEPLVMRTTTSDEVGQEPKISEGQEQELRSKNRILAQNVTEDLVLGYDLTLKDVVVEPEIFATCDGGKLVWDENKTHFAYSGPKTGEVVTRKRFTTDIWTEEKDADGETLGYQRFRFPGCKGSPVKFTHKDNAFFAPEYSLRSRPKLGQSPVDIASFDELPPATMTAAELLAYTQAEAPVQTDPPEEEGNP